MWGRSSCAFAAGTVQSAHQEHNQDSYCFRLAESPAGSMAMAVLCDGLSGYSAGELASASVADLFASWFEGEFAGYVASLPQGSRVSMEHVQEQWRELIQRANKGIREYCRSWGAMSATTVTAVLITSEQYLMLHVGDSRLYCADSQGVRQLSHDQVAMSPFGQRMLSQAVGSKISLKPEFLLGDCSQGALFALCSDGLYGTLDDGELDDLLFDLRDADEPMMQLTCSWLFKVRVAARPRGDATLMLVGIGRMGESWNQESLSPAASLPDDIESCD